MTVRAILTDIEGTTSSIAFVHDVLFPYARENLPNFIRANPDAVADQLTAAREEANEPDADTERVIEILLAWIAEDRKATSLKALQGLVWKDGYESGGFTGHVYDDAAVLMREWENSGIDLYVYSSGSVDAQKLLFGYSDAGDLRPLFRGYFDTRVGHKREAESYVTIAERIGLPANEILFLSDVAEELDAARDSGMQTMQLIRDDEVVKGSHTTAGDFYGVVLD